MKTVKRIFAIAVAVLLVAMMIPTAFAEDEPNHVNWTCNKPGYTYTVYKVATYNDDGSFTAVDSTMQSAVTAAVTQAQMADLADTCATATTLTATTKTFNTNAGSGSFTLANGIYFIKMTGKAPNFDGIKAKSQSIVVFPNKNGTGTENNPETVIFSGKINEGEPEANKYFLVDGNNTTNAQSFGTTSYKFGKSNTDTVGKDKKTITYVLEADIPGSATNMLESYVITDSMGEGLKAVTADDIVSVVVKPKTGATRTLTKGTEWTFTKTNSDINREANDTISKEKETTGNTFGIKLDKANVLQDTTKTFYGDGNKVVVTLTTELDYDVVKDMIGQEITNEDDMIYSNTAGFEVVPGGNVVAKTYSIFAQKFDASTNQPIVGTNADTKATFGLYEDEACTKQIASAQTGANGIADFGITLPAGTYYIKETAAPKGYNLNSTVVSKTLGDTQGAVATFTAEISDTPAKLPSTGGNGTMIFTIVGGSLVLLAAALFIIVMKKRSPAK